MSPKSLLRWAATFCYAAGIFYLSSRPWSGVPSIPYIDKVVHLGLYGGLGFLCAWSLGASVALGPRAIFLAALALSILYGFSDEFHQLYVPGRSAEFSDLVADAIGGALGALAAFTPALRRGLPAR